MERFRNDISIYRPKWGFLGFREDFVLNLVVFSCIFCLPITLYKLPFSILALFFQFSNYLDKYNSRQRQVPSGGGSVWGINDDIERSRSFAKTLRQSQENRWWTAKYNNAPRQQRVFSLWANAFQYCNILLLFLRFTGMTMSSNKLNSSRLYQSAPDLMYQEYLEQGLTRSNRTMSLCHK